MASISTNEEPLGVPGWYIDPQSADTAYKIKFPQRPLRHGREATEHSRQQTMTVKLRR